MARAGDFDFPSTAEDAWALHPLRREMRSLLERVGQLERLLLSPPTGCGHVFPLWMVIPPGGCWVNCPVCGVPRWIPGSMVTW